MSHITLILMGLGFCSLVLICIKTYQLYVLRSINQMHISKDIELFIERKDMDQALTMSEINKSQVAAQMALAGIKETLNRGTKQEIQNKIDEIILKEITKIESHLGKIELLGNISLLVGLIGTFISMIETFGMVDHLNPDEKARIISEGIKNAMGYSALGVAVSIVSLIAYSLLTNRTNKIVYELTKVGSNLFVKLLNYRS